MVNISGSYSLFATPDIEIKSKTGYGAPTYSIDTRTQSSDNVSAEHDKWNLVIFSVDEWVTG